LEVWLVTERLFPVPLQLTGDETVCGLDGFVLSGRPLGMGVRSLKPLVPRGLSALTCSAQRLLCRHTQLSRRRLEHLHARRGDTALQERSGAA